MSNYWNFEDFLKFPYLVCTPFWVWKKVLTHKECHKCVNMKSHSVSVCREMTFLQPNTSLVLFTFLCHDEDEIFVSFYGWEDIPGFKLRTLQKSKESGLDLDQVSCVSTMSSKPQQDGQSWDKPEGTKLTFSSAPLSLPEKPECSFPAFWQALL